MTVAEAQELVKGAQTIGAAGWGLYHYIDGEEENQTQEDEEYGRYESFQWDWQDGEGC